MHELKVAKKKMNTFLYQLLYEDGCLSLLLHLQANLISRETERCWWRLSACLCSVHDITITCFSRFFPSPWEELLNPILKIKKKLIFSKSNKFSGIHCNKQQQDYIFGLSFWKEKLLLSIQSLKIIIWFCAVFRKIICNYSHIYIHRFLHS